MRSTLISVGSVGLKVRKLSKSPVSFTNWHLIVVTVSSLLHPSLNPDSQGQSYWYSAGTRTEARNRVARQVLYDIHYYEEGQSDIPRAGFPVFG